MINIAYGAVEDNGDLASPAVIGGLKLDEEGVTATVELADDTILELHWDRAFIDDRVLALLLAKSAAA